MSRRPVLFASLAALAGLASADAQQSERRGSAAYGDWRADAPGIRRHITAADLPAPYASRSSGNPARTVAPPADVTLAVPNGFSVHLFARDLRGPRQIRVAPNGDVFVAESENGRIRVLRPNQNHDGVAKAQVFASGLNYPFGMAFYPADNPEWVYVGITPVCPHHFNRGFRTAAYAASGMTAESFIQ